MTIAKRFLCKTIFILTTTLCLTPHPAACSELEISGYLDASFTHRQKKETSTLLLDTVVFYGKNSFDSNNYLFIDFSIDKETITPNSNYITTVHQAYFRNTNLLDSKIHLTAGKFDTPVGFEQQDSPDRFQASSTLIIGSGIPESLTGVMLERMFGSFEIRLFVFNGFNQDVDNNESKSYGTRVGHVWADKADIGISVIRGPENNNNSRDNLSILDIDFMFKPFPKLLLGAEYNRGRYENFPFGRGSFRIPADISKELMLFMANYRFSQDLAGTLRLDGIKSINHKSFIADSPRVKRYTAAVLYQPRDFLKMVLEYRHANASRDTFLKKGGTELTDTEITTILKMTIIF